LIIHTKRLFSSIFVTTAKNIRVLLANEVFLNFYFNTSSTSNEEYSVKFDNFWLSTYFISLFSWISLILKSLIQLTHMAITKDLNLKQVVSEAERLDQRRTGAELEDAREEAETSLVSQQIKTADLEDVLSVPKSDREQKPAAGKVAKEANGGGGALSAFVSCLRFLLFSVPDHCAYW